MLAIRVIYGTDWCGDCKRSKRFLDENDISYEWVDIDDDQEARRKTMELNKGKARIPTIIFEDNSILVEPSNKELAKKLGIKYK